MNCREFLNEFEDRNALTETAALHLNDCAGCKKSSGEQTRVWQMLETLETIDAPNDFDFRLKARIATAKPLNARPTFSPALRLILPTGLAVLILAFVVFNGVYFVGEKTVPQVAESFSQPKAEKEKAPVNSATGDAVAADSTDFVIKDKPPTSISAPPEQPKQAKNIADNARFVAVRTGRRLPVVKRKDAGRSDFVGWRDSASTSSRVITPKEVFPNKAIEALPNSNDNTSSAVEQIMSRLGLETTLEDEARKVKSVGKNSVAERSGVKTGDIIQLIDGKKPTDESFGVKPKEAKKIVVSREAARIEISLRY